MGLRINSFANSLGLLGSIRRAGQMQNMALERLSTGLRINRASDDPSGLVVGQHLRAQISGLSQAIENSQNASNMVNTADAALAEVHDLLHEVRASVLASIGADADVVAAEQATVNNALTSIDRVAQTTRYGSMPLLNGTADFNVSSKSGALTELTIRQIQFAGGSQADVSVDVTKIASQATLAAVGAAATIASGGPVTIELRGPAGVETINLASGATGADLADAVNALRDNTGVYADSDALFTEEYGSQATISLTQVGGTGAYAGTTGSDEGVDAVASVGGISVTGQGRDLTITSTALSAEMTLGTGVSAGDTLTFTVEESGLTFQLGGSAAPSDRLTIGIQGVQSSRLGMPEYTVGGETRGGYLNTLRAGAANDLLNDPENALRIVDQAIDDVSNLRAHLGATEAFTIQPNINALEIGMQETANSLSTIMDTDYAAEVANMVRAQILLQAGVFVMGQSNSTPNMVLDLLSSVSG